MIILCYLSFGTFFIDVRIGERLGMGVTVLLAMFAVDGLTSVYLPICSESIWMNAVVSLSIAFATTAMFESLFVVWLHHYHQEKYDQYKEKHKEKKVRKSIISRHNLEMRSLNAELPVVKMPQVEAGTKSPLSYDIFGSSKNVEEVQNPMEPNKEATQASLESVIERDTFLQRRNLHEGNIRKSKLIDRWFICILPPAYTILLIIFFSNHSLVKGNSN